jgi:adenylate cyclase
MLRIPDPAQAVLFGLRITHELLRGHGAPAVRVGLHHGPAVERDGDYFGATGNLAARVAAVATGGEVLLTAHTAALAPSLDGICYEPRGRQTLRNIREPVELFAALSQGQPSTASFRSTRLQNGRRPRTRNRAARLVEPGRPNHVRSAA